MMIRESGLLVLGHPVNLWPHKWTLYVGIYKQRKKS